MKILQLLLIIGLAAALLFIAGCERKVVNEAKNDSPNLVGCFACHGETALDGAILEAEGEWKNSVHASGTTVDYANRGGGNDCTRCHSQQGFIDFLDSGKVFAPYSTVSAIHCFTCHAPHTNGNLELRTEKPFTLLNGQVFDHGAGNLCANCHHSRQSAKDIADADSTSISSRWGPHHGPQADILQGTNGYQYSGQTYTQTTHAVAVTDACVGCHKGQPQQHDGYQVGGHSFNMKFFDDETNATYTLVGVCQTCHSSFTSFDPLADNDYDGDGVIKGIQTEVNGMVDTLQTLLKNAGLLTLQSGEYLPPTKKVVKGDAGAVWNYLLIEADRSEGIHNKNYITSLLAGSINYMKQAHPSPANQFTQQ